MSKKALIHIGTGKTGTTSIQKSLSAQKHKLAGIGYPNVVGDAQHFLAVIYNERAKLARGHRNAYEDEESRLKDARDLKEKYLKELHKNDSVILSSEFLSRFEMPKIESLKTDLKEAGYTEYRIVCYVRNPISYYRSILQQVLKASHVPPHPEKFGYGVQGTIKNYRDCFGAENVVVKAFDSGLYQGDVVQDFVHQVEEFFGVKTSGIKSTTENNSISAEALFVLQRYRELYDFDKQSKITPKSKALLSYLAKLPASETTRIQLNPGVEEVLRRRFEDEVLWLKDNCGIDFDLGPSDTKYRKRNYQLLENIITKPSEASLDLIKFDIIDKFLGK